MHSRFKPWNQKLLLASASALLLAACSSLPTASDSGEQRLQTVSSAPSPVVESWTAASAPDGNFWLAWYGQRPGLNLRRPDGRHEVLIAETDSEQAPSGLALDVAGDNAWLGWRNKLPQRDVYLSRFGSQETLNAIGVSGDSVALARVKLHAYEDGSADALWYGEAEGHQATYNLFTRSLDAEGKPIDAQPQLVLPGIYPLWINQGGKQAVLSWVNTDDKSRIMARVRGERGGSFGEPVLVRETTPSITLPLDAFAVGKRWFVYWIAQHGENRQDYLVEGAWSDDQGASWQPFNIDSLRGTGIESMDIAGNGKTLVAVMGVELQDEIAAERKGRRMDIRLVRSEDNGQSWGEVQTLRNLTGADLVTRANNPRVLFLDDQRVVVIWQDWREIRSRVRYAYSEDAGQSWRVRDGRLPFVNGKNMGYHFFTNNLFADGKGGAHLLMEAASDRFASKDIVALHLSADELAQPLPDGKPQEGNLRQRVTDYWAALAAEDYHKAYATFDPFFRARRDFRSYMGDMGQIRYGKAEVLDVHLEGYRAHVKQSVVAGVPLFLKDKQLVEVPMEPRLVENTWLWIDNQWVLEYQSAREDSIQGFTRY